MSTATRAQKVPDTRTPARKLLTSFGFQILAALVLGVAAGLIGRQLGATAEAPNGLSATLSTRSAARTSRSCARLSSR